MVALALVRKDNRSSYSTAFTNQEAVKDRTEYVITLSE